MPQMIDSNFYEPDPLVCPDFHNRSLIVNRRVTINNENKSTEYHKYNLRLKTNYLNLNKKQVKKLNKIQKKIYELLDEDIFLFTK